eukprot:5495216-Pyramimonas_sp.AAC.1
MQKWRVVRLFPGGRPRFTLYTDACCEVRPPVRRPFVGLCYILLENASGKGWGGVASLSDEILDSFGARE